MGTHAAWVQCRRCCQNALRQWHGATNALLLERQQLQSVRAHYARQLLSQAFHCWLLLIPNGLPIVGPISKSSSESDCIADHLALQVATVKVAMMARDGGG